MAKQECSNPAELDQETMEAAGRCWECLSLSVKALKETHIGREIAKAHREAA